MEKHIVSLFNENILKEAALRYGASYNNVTKVGGFENFIYEFSLGEEIYILRISHSDHRTLELVEAELEWVNFLAVHQAFVSTPIKSVNDNLVEVIKCDNQTYFTATAYVKAKGTHVNKKAVKDDMLINYGYTVGILHQLTKKYIAKNSKRLNWDKDLLIVNALDYLPKSEIEIYYKLKDLLVIINSLPKDINNFGLIHNDIHMGNFFVNDNNITVFDFDDCTYMWFISDIAIALFYYVFFEPAFDKKNKLAENFMNLFMKGYQKANQIDSYWLKQLQYFLKLREIILYIAVYRSLDVETNEWAKKYISLYRESILNNKPFLDLDFTKFANYDY